MHHLYTNGPDKFSLGPGLWLAVKIYFFMLVLILLGVSVHQEGTQAKRPLGAWIRQQLGHHDFHDFLAQQSRELAVPYDDEVPECDYTTMTAKRFYNDYVKLNRPCIFRGYGQS